MSVDVLIDEDWISVWIDQAQAGWAIGRSSSASEVGVNPLALR